MPSAADTKSYQPLIDREMAAWRRSAVRYGLILAGITASCWYAGIFDGKRLYEGLPSIAHLAGEMLPPDFQNARSWAKPILDTLTMSIAGTVLAVMFSFPLALLGAPAIPPPTRWSIKWPEGP